LADENAWHSWYVNMILSPQWCNDSVVLVAVLRCLSILSFLILSSLLLLPVLLLLEWTEYLTTTNEWQFCSQQLTAVPSCAIALSLSSSQLPSGVVHGINSFDISFICIQNLWICDDLISVQQLMSFIALSMSAYDDILHAWYLTNMVSTSNVINVRVSSSSLQLTLMVCGASVVLVMLCSYFHSSTFDVCVVIHRHTSPCSNAVCPAATLSVLQQRCLSCVKCNTLDTTNNNVSLMTAVCHKSSTAAVDSDSVKGFNATCTCSLMNFCTWHNRPHTALQTPATCHYMIHMTPVLLS